MEILPVNIQDFDDEIIELIKNNKKVAIGKILKEQLFDDKINVLFLSVILDRPDMTKYIFKKIGLMNNVPPVDYEKTPGERSQGRRWDEWTWNHKYILMVLYYSYMYASDKMINFALKLTENKANGGCMYVISYDEYLNKLDDIKNIVKKAKNCSLAH